MSSTFLIALPGGSEWIIIGLLLLFPILAIVKILKNEPSGRQVVFILLAVFVPLFAIAYLIYSAVNANKSGTLIIKDKDKL